ncbi:MAG: CHAT domain-containing protein, partial [Spirulina sp. DLM2.Bin59]
RAEHPDVAKSFNNLAILYNLQVRYTDAEPLYLQALEMTKRLFGTEHPDVATSINNLAFLYRSQGRYAEAEPLYLQALEMRKRLLRAEHPDVAKSFNNLAILYLSQGDVTRAVHFFRQGLDVEEHNLDTMLTIGSESQKQDYMNTISGTARRVISLHLQTAPNHPEAAQLALTTLLRRKGRILEAVTDNLQTLRQNLTPANQKLLDDLAHTRSQLAALTFSPPENLPPEQYRQQISQLQTQANDLESQLARNSVEFRIQTEPVTIPAIQALIPSDAALIELVVYQPFNPTAPQGQQWAEPHYGAYILPANGSPQWLDLGPAAPINTAAQNLRQELDNPHDLTAAQRRGRELDALLMEPIRAKLGNAQHLLISPDSQLNLIPFAALVNPQNQYLLQTHQITYLTTGRDLQRLQLNLKPKSPPLVVANPDYGQSQVGPFIATNNRAAQRSQDLANLRFGDLPGTAAEAEALTAILPNATILTRNAATENAIKQVQGPEILHIATHGFFLEDVERVAAPDFGSGFDARGLISVRPRPGSTPRPRRSVENPLLRSGLALAGFNSRQSGAEDGALTALEVAGLNLWGTQLTILSACETGIGAVANGEGVYGLRRALVMAGSQSQLISLWKVSDEGTKDFMVAYYQRIMQGEGRGEALRQVQLAMLGDARYDHPFYWAAFVPSGDWRPMGD